MTSSGSSGEAPTGSPSGADHSTTGGGAADASRFLASYLQDHWLAVHGELRLASRAAAGALDAATRQELGALAREVAEDRAALLAILDGLGVDRPSMGERVVAAAERLGRLKTNGTVWRRSPVSDLVEIEGWIEAVQLRRLGWTALRELAEVDSRLNPYQLDLLIRRAEDQVTALEHLHLTTARRALTAPASGGGA